MYKLPKLYRECLRKKGYNSFKQAKHIAQKAMNRKGNNKQLYVYYCEHCNHYHLTSHPQTPAAIKVDKLTNFLGGHHNPIILPVDEKNNLGYYRKVLDN